MFNYVLSFLFYIAFVGTAFAADPFTVAGVPVDATADTAIEAQTTAISDGQLIAARILMERVTLPQERAANPLPELTLDTAAKLIRALEIANEKRSGSRYLGDITVAFNPSAVQNYLRGNELSMISTQARDRLVLPVSSDSRLFSDNAWLSAWRSPQFSHALTPISLRGATAVDNAVISTNEAASLNMAALKRAGQRFGVNQILIAELGSDMSARVIDIALDTGQKRNLGRVNGSSFSDLANRIVKNIENDWKQASVSLAENAVTTVVTVLYDSHREWQNLQDAINSSAQIQDARLDALSKDGALMTLTYGGDMGRLQNELAFKGMTITQDPKLGLVLARTGRL